MSSKEIKRAQTKVVNKVDDDSVFKKNPDMVTRKIDEEVILVPIFRTSDEMNCIYTLNEPASFIWDMINGKNSVAEIKKKTFEEFKTKPEEVERKLNSLFKDFVEIKAVI